MKKATLLTCLLALVLIAQGQTPEAEDSRDGFIKLNSEFSYNMLEPNQDLRKVDIFADSRADTLIENGNLYIGASVIAIADYQHSDQANKFGYLMRHPTASNQIGQDVSEAVLHSAQLGLAAPINDWLAAYLEILYDPQQSFGQGTITALTRNQLQLRKGYVVIGNQDRFPLFLAIGKMDANFGQTGSVSPFTNSTMWHAFGGLGYGAVLQFEKKGFEASFMAVQGGAQFRAMNAPVEGTDVPSRLNNFVADLNYTFEIWKNAHFKLGGSYLKGSAYCQDFPVTHFTACEETNPAFSAYGNLNVNDRLLLKGSYAATTEKWPGTHNPNPPLDEFGASKVTSMDIGALFRINPEGKVVYSVSAEFSNFVAGPDGAPWHRQNQLVVGGSAFVNQSCRLFGEVFRTEGYVPLNFISGGNFEDLGVTHSLEDTQTLGLVIGALITI